MTTPLPGTAVVPKRGVTRVLMIATVKLFQQSNAGLFNIVQPGGAFWCDVVDQPGLLAGNLASNAPVGTPAPPPEPPYTVNGVVGLGRATANSSH